LKIVKSAALPPVLPLPANFGARALVFAAIFGLTACGNAPAPNGIQDPHETQNRGIHALNLALDKNLVRPLATGASNVVPDQVGQSVVNFADNLELPGAVVNDILQWKLADAAENSARFLINTTFGIGGLFDPATKAGAPGNPTDFGETLHVWGVAEGNYIELPILGPSTDRDAVGRAVDYMLDPLKLILPQGSNLPLTAWAVGEIAQRGRYSDTVDSILYDSADSYAQSRLLYLDNRRFELGIAPSDDQFEDPYAQ
jgi:phospholipid-binding lipoprotein MlaA